MLWYLLPKIKVLKLPEYNKGEGVLMCAFIIVILAVIVVYFILTNTGQYAENKRAEERAEDERKLKKSLEEKHYYEDQYYYEVFSEMPPATGDYCNLKTVDSIYYSGVGFKRVYFKCEYSGTQRCVYCVRRGRQFQPRESVHHPKRYKLGSSNQCRKESEFTNSEMC